MNSAIRYILRVKSDLGNFLGTHPSSEEKRWLPDNNAR